MTQHRSAVLIAVVTQAITEMRGAKTLVRVNEVYRRAVQACGFATYAVGYVPLRAGQDDAGQDESVAQRSPFLLLDWPKTWLELYAREGFAAEDIVIAEAARSSEPFTWTDIRVRHPGASGRIFAAAAEFGWSDGFVIPVHAPKALLHQRFAVASLAADRLDGFDQATRALVVRLSLVAFAQAVRVSDGMPDKTASGLTERERQALTLVAEGHGDAEIAAALGISRATAHYHVEQAKKKLGATTRAQAIAIALTRSLM